MDIELIIIVIGFTIAFLLEAKQDFIISEKEALIRYLLKDDQKQIKKEQKTKEQWHTKDWQYLAVIAMITAILYKGITVSALAVLVLISSLKILVFNIRLNSLFKVELLYLSSDGLEGKFKGKELFYYAIAAILLIASITYLWIM